MKTIIVYDNHISKSEAITDIIGQKGFADVVIHKQRVEEYTAGFILPVFQQAVWKKISSAFEYAELETYLKQYEEDEVHIVHLFANAWLSNPQEALLSFQKFNYAQEPWRMTYNGKTVCLFFPHIKTYLTYCKNSMAGLSVAEASDMVQQAFEAQGIADLSNIQQFTHYITAHADSRYFNSLEEDAYTLTKTSTDKIKLKKEYTYYRLLPDDMKRWFVMPYNYQENEKTASYMMERLHMTDLAIKWVHGSISLEDFAGLLTIYFHFFNNRHARTCTAEVYHRHTHQLYIEKLDKRLRELKNHSAFPRLAQLLAAGEISLDNLVERYKICKQKIEQNTVYPLQEVIGHGDPGFANTLYNKATRLLKFVDPKGALCDEELWTHPYYDIAKLSHCICGRYDFFNQNLFDIKLNKELHYELSIPFNQIPYQQLFKQQVTQHGFDYNTVRVYEVSLFLSMLPLHMDNPYKVVGFILNARNILEELESYV